MRFRTLAKIAILLVAGALFFVVLVLKTTDTNEYRDLISLRVKSATGREILMKGPLDFRLFPEPALKVDDVTLANVSWGSRPEMLKLKRLEILLDPISLVFGDIRVKRLKLIEPHILVEKNRKGQWNWFLGENGNFGQKPGFSASGQHTLEGITKIFMNFSLVEVKPAFRNFLSLKKDPALGSGAGIFKGNFLPLNYLRRFDTAIHAEQGQVKTAGLNLEGLSLDITLSQGELNIKTLRGRLGGAPFSLGMSLSSQNSKAVLEARFEAQNLDIGPLLKIAEVTDVVSMAKIDLEGKLKGRGESLKALLAGLSGNIEVRMDEGKIDNKYLGQLAPDLGKLLTPLGLRKDYTDVNCLFSRFDIENGMATNKGFLFDMEEVTVGGEGQINFGEESLDLNLEVKLKKAGFFNLTAPVSIRGSLAEPTVTLNTESVVQGLAGALLGSNNSDGPPIPEIGKGGGGKNPCLAALGME